MNECEKYVNVKMLSKKEKRLRAKSIDMAIKRLILLESVSNEEYRKVYDEWMTALEDYIGAFKEWTDSWERV